MSTAEFFYANVGLVAASTYRGSLAVESTATVMYEGGQLTRGILLSPQRQIFLPKNEEPPHERTSPGRPADDELRSEARVLDRAMANR